MTTKRKRKFVALLRNRTDSRDDETLTVWALDEEAALKLVSETLCTNGRYINRFYVRAVLTAKQARHTWV